MLALVIIEAVVIALLAILVAGLLRSHADILRALHSLGAGVGDPAQPADGSTRPIALTTAPAGGPLTMGPPLPAERGQEAHDVAGVTPDGGALSVTAGRGLTLFAFLTSGCGSCAAFWSALAAGDAARLLPGIRVVVVTKGPELESPGEVGNRPVPVPVIMSSAAWDDYEVPGSPFFVLVDGERGRRIGEGVANRFEQVADLVRRAEREVGARRVNRDGPDREAENDLDLLRAGIQPGDPSLYPTSLADVFADPPRPGAPD
jgi:hypothetical protein